MAQKDNETKRRIIQVSLALIKEKGYDQVTLNEICAAAQISKHTFYYYFSSKEDVLRGFFEIPKEITTQRLMSILEADSGVEQLWKLMEPHIDFFHEQGPEVVKRIFIANLNRDQGTFNLPHKDDSIPRAEAAIIKKAQDNGEIQNKADCRLLLGACMSALIGVAAKWCISDAAFSLKKATRANLEAILDVRLDLRKSGEHQCFH